MTARWLGRVAIDGRILWYAEMLKIYSDGTSTPRCGPSSLLRVWFVEDDRRQFTQLEHEFLFTDCDVKEDTHVSMLGALTIDGHPFVVTTEHGYEDEHYVIYEVTPTRLVPVLTVTGGGC